MAIHTPKKRFGQNFLQDQYIIQQIIRLINPSNDQCLVEIGPGLGALTKPLLAQVQHLDVVEIDRDIIAHLKETYTPEQLTIHECDALQFNFNLDNKKIRVIGNLPYNISTPLLFHLNTFSNIIDMHFMLQKEVVDRICAVPNNGDYGRLSIMLQYKYICTKMIDVSAKCFYPAPKVESAIVRLVPRPQNEWQDINEQKLNHIVTNAFSQRRKTILNSLKSIFTKEQLVDAGIDITKRAENLSIYDYIKLSKLI